MVNCFTYSAALDEIIHEILSLQRFVQGCIFVYTSEKLVFPLLPSILDKVGDGLIGFINLQEIFEETFHGEESQDLTSICREVLSDSFDLSDTQETTTVLFNLVKHLMNPDFDSFIAPYCKYSSALRSTVQWKEFSSGLRSENNSNIR